MMQNLYDFVTLSIISKIKFEHFLVGGYLFSLKRILIEPVHEISNIIICATSKGSDQPAHTRSLIRAFASR